MGVSSPFWSPFWMVDVCVCVWWRWSLLYFRSWPSPENSWIFKAWLVHSFRHRRVAVDEARGVHLQVKQVVFCGEETMVWTPSTHSYIGTQAMTSVLLMLVTNLLRQTKRICLDVILFTHLTVPVGCRMHSFKNSVYSPPPGRRVNCLQSKRNGWWL